MTLIKKVERYLELPNVVSVQYADVLKYGKAVFWLGHYPTITANYDDDKPIGQSMLYAYLGTLIKNNLFIMITLICIMLGMDAHNCTPITIDEIVADIRKEGRRN